MPYQHNNQQAGGSDMFKWLRSDPIEKLEKQYRAKLEEARDAQRGGKIPLYAELIAESEQIANEIDALRKKAS